jgi:hypothetical protein
VQVAAEIARLKAVNALNARLTSPTLVAVKHICAPNTATLVQQPQRRLPWDAADRGASVSQTMRLS